MAFSLTSSPPVHPSWPSENFCSLCFLHGRILWSQLIQNLLSMTPSCRCEQERENGTFDVILGIPVCPRSIWNDYDSVDLATMSCSSELKYSASATTSVQCCTYAQVDPWELPRLGSVPALFLHKHALFRKADNEPSGTPSYIDVLSLEPCIKACLNVCFQCWLWGRLISRVRSWVLLSLLQVVCSVTVICSSSSFGNSIMSKTTCSSIRPFPPHQQILQISDIKGNWPLMPFMSTQDSSSKPVVRTTCRVGLALSGATTL